MLLVRVDCGRDPDVGVTEVATGGEDAVLAGDDAANFLAQGVDGFVSFHALSPEPGEKFLENGVTAVAAGLQPVDRRLLLHDQRAATLRRILQ